MTFIKSVASSTEHFGFPFIVRDFVRRYSHIFGDIVGLKKTLLFSYTINYVLVFFRFSDSVFMKQQKRQYDRGNVREWSSTGGPRADSGRPKLSDPDHSFMSRAEAHFENPIQYKIISHFLKTNRK